MKSINDWKKERDLENLNLKSINREDFLKIALEYFKVNLKGNLKSVHEHVDSKLTESAETSRYSISVNYRTTMDDALDGFAKLVLGYVSAGLLVSSRNWDDGEWTGLVTWSDKEKCFLVSKGFYNKDRKTISIQSTKKCADSASEIAKELHNMMHHLKTQPNNHQEKLKSVSLKRGPK